MCHAFCNTAKLPCSETKGQLGGNNISDISHHRENITSALLRWYKSAKLLLTRIITIKQIHSRGRVVVVKSLIIRSVWAYNTYFITPLQIQQDVKMIRDNSILSSGLHFLASHICMQTRMASARHGNAWIRSHVQKSTRFHKDITIPERASVRLINLNVLYSSVMRVVILAPPVMMADAVSSLSRHLWRYVCTCRFQLRAHYVSNSLINCSCHVTLALHHEPLAHSVVVSEATSSSYCSWTPGDYGKWTDS